MLVSPNYSDGIPCLIAITLHKCLSEFGKDRNILCSHEDAAGINAI